MNEAEGIRFIYDEGEIFFNFEEIDNIHQYPDSVHVEIKLPTLSFSKKIKIYNLDLKKEIETAWLKKKNSPKETIAYKIHNWNVKKILSISLIVIPAFVALVMFFFFNAYYLIPEDYDVYMGNSVHEKIVDQFSIKECENTKLKTAVNDILERIPKKKDTFKYSILIADSDTINALALPGGKMIVFHELIEKTDSPEELAGFLAHEISHIEKKHDIQQMVRTLGFSFLVSIFIGGFAEGFETIETVAEIGATLLFFKYSRSFEEEADKNAMKKLIEADINPAGFINFFKKIQELEDEILDELTDTDEEKETFYELSDWLSTHPSSEDRVKILKKGMPADKKDYKPFTGISSWDTLKSECQI